MTLKWVCIFNKWSLYAHWEKLNIWSISLVVIQSNTLSEYLHIKARNAVFCSMEHYLHPRIMNQCCLSSKWIQMFISTSSSSKGKNIFTCLSREISPSRNPEIERCILTPHRRAGPEGEQYVFWCIWTVYTLTLKQLYGNNMGSLHFVPNVLNSKGNE